MVKKGALWLAVMTAPGAIGASWTVCIEDSKPLLSTPLRAAMWKEFRTVLGSGKARLTFGGCADDPRQILLEIQAEPPEALSGVLGRAHRRSGAVRPSLEVFYGAMVRYLGKPISARALGRALARVAAHEVAHFLAQEVRHCSHGLMRPMFAAHELLAADPTPFRTARRFCPEVAAKTRHEPVGLLASTGASPRDARVPAKRRPRTARRPSAVETR